MVTCVRAVRILDRKERIRRPASDSTALRGLLRVPGVLVVMGDRIRWGPRRALLLYPRTIPPHAVDSALVRRGGPDAGGVGRGCWKPGTWNDPIRLGSLGSWTRIGWKNTTLLWSCVEEYCGAAPAPTRLQLLRLRLRRHGCLTAAARSVLAVPPSQPSSFRCSALAIHRSIYRCPVSCLQFDFPQIRLPPYVPSVCFALLS